LDPRKALAQAIRRDVAAYVIEKRRALRLAVRAKRREARRAVQLKRLLQKSKQALRRIKRVLRLAMRQARRLGAKTKHLKRLVKAGVKTARKWLKAKQRAHAAQQKKRAGASKPRNQPMGRQPSRAAVPPSGALKRGKKGGLYRELPGGGRQYVRGTG
jgi:hypothetical protein